MTIQYNMYYGTYYIEYNVLKVKATILGHQLVDAYFVPLMESIVTRMYFFFLPFLIKFMQCFRLNKCRRLEWIFNFTFTGYLTSNWNFYMEYCEDMVNATTLGS